MRQERPLVCFWLLTFELGHPEGSSVPSIWNRVKLSSPKIGTLGMSEWLVPAPALTFLVAATHVPQASQMLHLPCPTV